MFLRLCDCHNGIPHACFLFSDWTILFLIADDITPNIECTSLAPKSVDWFGGTFWRILQLANKLERMQKHANQNSPKKGKVRFTFDESSVSLERNDGMKRKSATNDVKPFSIQKLVLGRTARTNAWRLIIKGMEIQNTICPSQTRRRDQEIDAQCCFYKQDFNGTATDLQERFSTNRKESHLQRHLENGTPLCHVNRSSNLNQTHCFRQRKNLRQCKKKNKL